MKRKLRLIINTLVIISSMIGLGLTFKSSSFMSTSSLYYYTIQSNIWVLLIMIIFVFYDLFNFKIKNSLYIAKYSITVGITLTFFVFLFMLTPQIILTGDISYLSNLSNLTLHFISPILAIISFIFFDKISIKKHYYLYGTIIPLYYMIFAFILGEISTTGVFRNFDGTPCKFPYFFFNHELNGWFTINNGFFGLGTFYWMIILCLFVILISILFLKLNTKQQKTKS